MISHQAGLALGDAGGGEMPVRVQETKHLRGVDPQLALEEEERRLIERWCGRLEPSVF